MEIIDDFSSSDPRELTFVDTSIDNYQSLIPEINSTEIILLNNDRDGIAQITETLATKSDLDSINIISHGNDAQLQLGNIILNHNSLPIYTEQLQSWDSALAKDADILVFGCNVASTEIGKDFIQQISNLTGADIAASHNLTGNALLNGDWNLEVETGVIEADSSWVAEVAANYNSVLVTFNGNEYQLTSNSGTWAEAQAEAEALGGNLVTINDVAEQAWLEDTFGGTERLWTGLSDRAQEGEFEWTSGESVTYTNWAANQPNNFGRGEDFTVLLANGKWNDVGGNANLRGIIEIGDDNPTQTEVFTYNGNEYRLTSTNLTWAQAQAEAESIDGNLVTINDLAEQEWLEDTFGGTERLWTGLTDAAVESQFEWSSGETLSYTNWAPNQPNNFGLGENFVALQKNGKWNDYSGGIRLSGIIEIGSSIPNNPGVIGLETNSYQVNEEDGTVEVTVLRTQGSDGVVTVDYQTFEATATENEDYNPVSGTVTFADGETSQTVEIAILDDNKVEGTEDFSITIDNVTGGATLLAPRTALIDIIDNDTIPDALSYNGNQYFLTSGVLTWEQAQTEAENFGGNLVSINDGAEEAWLKDNFGATEVFWTGINDLEDEGNFVWVSGQPVTYTNWAPGEPNDFNGIQDFGVMNFGGTRQWDDNNPSATFRGIIEIGGSNPSPNGTGNGLRGEYFDDIDFTNSKVIRTDSTVNFDWGAGSPNPAIASNTFSVRWTGEIEAKFSETYTFQTTTDDGVRLWVNDQLIINEFIDQPATSHQGEITLTAGQKYDIRLDYYENGGQASAELAWSSASQALEIVPQSQLYSPIINDRTLTQETVFSGLSAPTAIDWTSNGDLAFIAEKGGVIKVADNGQLQNSPFIDISAQVNGVRDRGLLDIAVHPDFYDGSPYVYALYTYDPPEVFDHSGLAGEDGIGNRAARLTRITADEDNNFKTAIAGSEVVILGTNSTWENFNAFANSTNDFSEPPAGILADGSNLEDFLAADSESHTIGGVEFGPDKKLYVSNGDGTSYNRVDPRTVRVQDIDNLSGKILRIDPITGEGLSDNPFYNGNPNANRSKVYQYGLRNPFRIAVDQTDGKVYVGDVGWTKWEEINAAAPGANFGWPYYEGGSGTNLQTGGYRDLSEAQAFYASGESATPSILALNHSADGINAIVLGDIYRGTNFPEEYQGDLFFNDLGQGIVRNVSFDESGNITSVDTFATGANIVVQIVEGPDGHLYYVDLDDGEVGLWKFA